MKPPKRGNEQRQRHSARQKNDLHTTNHTKKRGGRKPQENQQLMKPGKKSNIDRKRREGEIKTRMAEQRQRDKLYTFVLYFFFALFSRIGTTLCKKQRGAATNRTTKAKQVGCALCDFFSLFFFFHSIVGTTQAVDPTHNSDNP